MDHLWLGYDNLVVHCADVAVVLLYHSALDQRIVVAYGRVPFNIRTVVVTSDGSYWPSSWRAEQLRSRLTRWRISDVG
ncbi:MAG: hypothetical protein SH847_17030 [Roseiflexaceae bacterium]|nr:hypothetical protein [Roseiflexaceae bacterium]